MRIALLANKKAGRGRGLRVATRAADHLSAPTGGGHDIDLVPVGPGTDPGATTERIARAQVVVAAGGDGTVLHAARTILAAESRPALYHLPCGNENLFAREFGMTRSPQLLARSLQAGRIEAMDAGWISAEAAPPELFLIMASLGPDASAIQRLARAPRRWSGHAAYAGPVWHELCAPWFPAIRVRADGRDIAAGRDAQGILVVANSRHYALRMDPARRARVDDGRLDAVWLPCRTRMRAIRWAAQCRLGRHLQDPAARYDQATRIEIQSIDGRPLPVQVDGEAFAPDREVRSLVLTITPAALPVLRPA